MGKWVASSMCRANRKLSMKKKKGKTQRNKGRAGSQDTFRYLAGISGINIGNPKCLDQQRPTPKIKQHWQECFGLKLDTCFRSQTLTDPGTGFPLSDL